MKQTPLCPYPLFPTSFFSAIRASIVLVVLLSGSLMLTSCSSSKFSFVGDTPATLSGQKDFKGNGSLIHDGKGVPLLITQNGNQTELVFHHLDDKLESVRSFSVAIPEQYRLEHAWNIGEKNVLILMFLNHKGRKKYRAINVDLESKTIIGESDINDYALAVDSRVSIAFSPDSSVFAYCEWEEYPDEATTLLIDIFHTDMRRIESVRKSYGNIVQGDRTVLDMLVNNEGEIVVVRSARRKDENVLVVEYVTSSGDSTMTRVPLPSSMRDTAVRFGESVTMMNGNDEIFCSAAIEEGTIAKGLTTFHLNYRTGEIYTNATTELTESDLDSLDTENLIDLSPHTIHRGKNGEFYVFAEELALWQIRHERVEYSQRLHNSRVVVWYTYRTRVSDLYAFAYDRSGKLLWKDKLLTKYRREEELEDKFWDNCVQKTWRRPVRKLYASSIHLDTTSCTVFYRHDDDDAVHRAEFQCSPDGISPLPDIPLVSLPGKLTFKHLDYQNVLWQADGSAVMIGHGANTSRIMHIALP